MEYGKAENIIALVKDAQTSYLEEVEKGKKVYSRYVKDFLNSHRYSGSWDVRVMNEHHKNLGIMEDLLETRQDLVDKYFQKKERLTEEDIHALIHELNTTEVSEKRLVQPMQSSARANAEEHRCDAQNTSDKNKGRASSLQLAHANELVEHIMELMNELKLFTGAVNKQQVRKLFDCTSEKPLVARNNREVAYFFDSLCEHGLICKQWQEVVATYQLVRSSTGKAMKSSDLSSALCKAKASDRSIYTCIRNMVKEITKWQ